MRELCTGLRTRSADILIAWQVATQDELWRSLSRAERINAIPDLLHGLIDTAVCAGQEHQGRQLAAYRHVIDVGLTHGAIRRAQGLSLELLFVEYHRLREVVWRELQRMEVLGLGARNAAQQAILWIDAAITIATRASLHGYHRAEHDGRGTWESAIDSMLEEAALLIQRRR